MGIRKYVRDGEMIPKGYGVAWVDYVCDRAVYYPIGLNMVISFSRDVYFWIKHFRKGWIFKHDEEIARVEWYRGYDSGKRALSMIDVSKYLEANPRNRKLFRDMIAQGDKDK